MADKISSALDADKPMPICPGIPARKIGEGNAYRPKVQRESRDTARVKADLFQQYMERCDRVYDSKWGMLALKCYEVGYHSRLRGGVTVHPTRESLQYALALLCSGEERCRERAKSILQRVLALQDQDALSRTYGVWPWYADESLDEMSPPDWNWADFLGARLAQIIHDHDDVLSADLIEKLRSALGHAAWSIFRRNVGLGYTNIAIMGGGVTAVAGEMLNNPQLLTYGRERLKRTVELARYHGSFTEYNSPTYTMTAIEECERILHLSKDPGVRQAAGELREIGWEVIAEHFHPGTGQWAGPQSRAYSNQISAGLAHYLSEQTGAQIAPHQSAQELANDQVPSLIPSLPCPESWRGRFVRLPENAFTIQRRFIRKKVSQQGKNIHGLPALSGSKNQIVRYAYGDRIGTTWFSQTSVLGSINHEDTWDQRRSLFGYWKTEYDTAVCLRLRFLHDGKDFASGFVRNLQDRQRVLSAVTLLTDRGDWHPSLDRPLTGHFLAQDFRLRYELTGEGVSVCQVDRNQFALAAGGHRAVVVGVPGVFGAHEIRWEAAQEEGCAFVDAICYAGPQKEFNFKSMDPVILASGLELQDDAARVPDPEPVSIKLVDESTYEAAWSKLNMVIPCRAHAYAQ